MSLTWINRLSLASIVLALCVIVLGAYTRLSDAGLGCPDWPGCYGQLTAPRTDSDITAANKAFPFSLVDPRKAHIEMTHRYFAQALAFVIVLLSVITFIKRHSFNIPGWLPGSVFILVILQGLLGMWTVTLKLLPIIVLSHLIGGFSTLSLLWLIYLSLRCPLLPTLPFSNAVSKLAMITLFMLIVQILLGGWTSANFASLMCPDFPLCQGKWIPELSLGAFDIYKGSFSDFALNGVEKTTIHFSHRLGALITLSLGFILSFQLYRQTKDFQDIKLRGLFIGASHLLASLLCIQVALGISNIVFHLALANALAHHAIAALLLLTLITINYLLIKARK